MSKPNLEPLAFQEVYEWGTLPVVYQEAYFNSWMRHRKSDEFQCHAPSRISFVRQGNFTICLVAFDGDRGLFACAGVTKRACKYDEDTPVRAQLQALSAAAPNVLGDRGA